MRKLTILFVLIIWFKQSEAQYARGFLNDNYSGLQAVGFNPANLADSRSKFAFNMVSVYADANNNHIQLETPYSQWKVLRGTLPDQYLDQNGVALFKNEYAVEKFNGGKKHVYASGEVQGPSFMFNLDDKSGFAFTNKTRFFANVSGLNESLVKIFLEDLDTTAAGYTSNQNQKRYEFQRHQQRLAGVGVSAFEEFGFSYARVLYNKKENFFKGGVTLKYLIGMGAAHIDISDLDYELVKVDSMHIYSADIGVSYVDEAYYNNPDLRLNDLLGGNKLGNGMGIDIGVVYEYRPNYKYYKYKMDRKTHEDRSKNKYKFKVGASINDFGVINYKNSQYLTRININSEQLVKWNDFNSVKSLGGTTDSDSFIYSLFEDSDSVNRFRSKLPTSLNINFDYNLQDDWYIGGSYVQSLRLRNVTGVKKQNVLALNARYEKEWYGGSVSLLTSNWYHPVHIGLMLRGGPLFIGTDHLASLLTPKKTDGINIYAGLQFKINYNRISDIDDDGVSDEKDKCIDIAGSPSARGCPDEDGDRVPDSEDLCPDQPGTKLTKGCPDEDGDRIIGAEDKCPTKAGEKENDGCPDSDEDGIYDHLDRCPDQAGVPENDGCPADLPEEKPKKQEKDTVQPEKVTPKVDEPKEEAPKKEAPKKEVPEKTQPEKVEPKKETPEKKENEDKGIIIIEEDTGIETEYDDIINKMKFDEYNYYIILGAYTNKDYADYLVANLSNKANVKTFIFREVEGSTYYVTIGKASDKKTAQEQVRLLSRPEVKALINGHLWWKKIPR